ncbi:hypothetical protein MOX02_11020 [Methylobacterium oxalidis]|uniref:Uncharacterized protein n=1 Tax=Methylobacterium oxalidis TaxID=944322 RepID=A0A512IZC4_9HYPH|nr:hypothetical protein MOX02_11020 [Methylobacterium oxalidis]GLS67323.1 hypothetical protein GCM10007888_57070 [Methylobacterium oxalidis]
MQPRDETLTQALAAEAGAFFVLRRPDELRWAPAFLERRLALWKPGAGSVVNAELTAKIGGLAPVRGNPTWCSRDWLRLAAPLCS